MLDCLKVKTADQAVYRAMMDELDRQENNIELIASENFVSEAVMDAMGSHLTNKYAEGYPGKRYYGGCEFVDVVETLAIERAKNCSGQNLPTCSRTLAPKPIPRFILPCLSLEMSFSV